VEVSTPDATQGTILAQRLWCAISASVLEMKAQAGRIATWHSLADATSKRVFTRFL